MGVAAAQRGGALSDPVTSPDYSAAWGRPCGRKPCFGPAALRNMRGRDPK